MTRRSVVVNAALVVALGAVIAGAVVAIGDPGAVAASSQQTATVSRGTVQSTVTASGNLSAATNVDLSFSGTGGTVTAIYVQVGDRVHVGRALARVDGTSARQSLAVAESSLASAKANYAVTVAGQTSAQKAQSSAQLRSAQVGLDNAKNSLSQAKATHQLDKSQQNALVAAAQSAYDSAASATKASAKAALAAAERTRDSTLLRDQQSIQNAQGQVKSAEASLQSQEASSAVNAEGATAGTIASARAQVTSAQVQVDEAEAALEETVLRAPVDGTVSSINGAVGQSSSGGSGSTDTTAGTAFMSLSSLDNLQVRTMVAEADATSVKLGQPAIITFSASNATANGTVTAIDVSSTVTNNVVEYGITVTLTETPRDLKLGQTASVSITTGTAENVLSVPTTAVTKIGKNATVTVRSNGVDTPTPVTVGVEGDSTTEITSGLNEGDVVVLSSDSGAPTGFTFPTGGFPGGPQGGLGG